MPRAVPPRRRFGWLFLAAAAALAAAFACFSVGVRSYIAATGRVEHTLEVQRQVDQWVATVLDAQTGARGYVATGNRAFLAPYEAALPRERTQAVSLRTLVSDNAGQAAGVESAAREADGIMHRVTELVTLVRSGKREVALDELATEAGKQMLEDFRRDVQAILSEEGRLLARRQTTAVRWRAFTLGGASVLMLAAAGLLVFAWRREREHDAVTTVMAKDARQRLRTLGDVASALSETRTVAQVARVVVQDATRVVGSDTCTLHLLSEMETIVEKRGVSIALGAIVEGSGRRCASRRSARARAGADGEVLGGVGEFSASRDLLIAAA